jgi:3-methylcrotonyl-CoA carboxylase alpha subunit
MNEPHRHRVTLDYRGRQVDVSAEQLNNGDYRLAFEDSTIVAGGSLREDSLRADIDGFQQTLSFAEHDGTWSAYRTSGAFHFREQLADLGDADLAGAGGNPRAPMNGVVVQLLAKVGSTVEADAPLLVMEAMKMEHTIRAPVAGTVTEFFFQAGELVDGDAELLNFEAADAG